MKNFTRFVAEFRKLCAIPETPKVLGHLCTMLKWATLLALIMLLWRILPLLSGLMS